MIELSRDDMMFSFDSHGVLKFQGLAGMPRWQLKKKFPRGYGLRYVNLPQQK
jgi:hypothetical protein